MRTDYSHYKDIDFLDDDFFVESMISPTRESELFWSELVDRKKIDINEFISAIMLLDTIRKGRHEISQVRKDRLWKRIDATRKSLKNKRKGIHRYKYPVIAACGAILIGFMLPFLSEKKDVSDRPDTDIDYTQFQSIQQQQAHEEIRIVTEDGLVEIDGKDAEIKYDSTGSFTVNNEETRPDTVYPSVVKLSYNQLSVPYGKRASLTLADGTSLWVNAGTTVIYPATFPDNKREIYVDGEVYAEVQRAENRPFLVKTSQLEIEVVGTSFNLSAYKEDSFKRVVLVNGSVNVRQNGLNTRLIPNQSYTYTQQGSNVETVDTEIYTSWRDGIYIFRDEPIENILQQLARYYNVTMIFPPQPSGTLCSGKLELKEDLSHLLNNLSQIASFNFGVKDNEYRIQFNQ
ncbi:FecR family protein [Proteiniphilum acetatigenes]|uniref:FecR family protein n=1 Tax=Proteiniphilum acetatigenes TaxID=294710 RepID=UPI00037873C0|nr:FecR domain-containing protein [Proteiniphilum acetatigenes]SEA42432.1 FecR family protein [Porphyromonadaceae bacterium KH3R12]SFK42334.1 FecR protein [Porphyromonadaceae bacterium KH3CP3RA]SFT09968.1 FecR family protein [Porphyromonadaceae bacterium NLAE-zl-C104]